MITVSVCFVLVALLVTPSLQQDCDPAKCALPNCRCWGDPTPPGNVAVADTPQMVVISFQNNINTDDVENYKAIFGSVVNPNGCAIKGTFFIEDQDTNYGLVKELMDDKFEVGVNSINDIIPTTSSEWNNMIKSVLSKFTSVGIDSKSVYGLRAPQLRIGGNEMLIGMGDNNLQYDSSCTSVARSLQATLVWPYTFDFDTPTCDNGNPPALSFPGKWELYIAALEWNGVPCATPAACPGITTKKDAFDLFYSSFRRHYEGKRTPMVLSINPSWAKTDNFREGTIEFLQYLRAAFSDVWIVTGKQALDWVQAPVPLANITTFAPWQC